MKKTPKPSRENHRSLRLSSGYEGAINGAFGISIFPIWLVVWNVIYVSIQLGIIIPIDELIIFSWVGQPPTSYTIWTSIFGISIFPIYPYMSSLFGATEQVSRPSFIVESPNRPRSRVAGHAFVGAAAQWSQRADRLASGNDWWGRDRGDPW